MTDEMKIGTTFMKSMVGRIINKSLKRKLGCDVGVKLNDFNVIFDNEKAHVHLNVDAEMTQAELTKLLISMGLS